jgi:hypothetical protein
MPDFEDPLTLTGDIALYFDDIMVNNDPAPNSAAAYVIEDYEIMPLNLMTGDPLVDLSTMTVVPNPDASGINTSNYVVEFFRDKDGVPWGGFWSATPVDVTTNKYMHVKVWKPRISPIKFKIEGGAAGTIEAPSMNPQTKIGEWEDIVFDFSAKTGPYPVVAFMPDFEDPLVLTDNITLYFDDIILNNDPSPLVGIAPVSKDNKVSVYPSPFSNFLTVNAFADLKSISITSVIGQQVINMENLPAGKTTINTSMLTSGIYFVTINPKSDSPYTVKVMKY